MNQLQPGRPIPEKPVSSPDLHVKIELPELDDARIRARNRIIRLCQSLTRLCTCVSVTGLENVPVQGPLLLVTNHLGDADSVLNLATFPRQIDPIAKIELRKLPIIGYILQTYGVIWIRRGRPDRQALHAALRGLAAGRMIMINPEGRESATGALEQALDGAAYLAIKSGAPILPSAITGTENSRIYPNMLRLKRTEVTLTIGPIFYLPETHDRRADIERGTQMIMQSIASLLPTQYRGVYA